MNREHAFQIGCDRVAAKIGRQVADVENAVRPRPMQRADLWKSIGELGGPAAMFRQHRPGRPVGDVVHRQQQVAVHKRLLRRQLQRTLKERDRFRRTPFAQSDHRQVVECLGAGRGQRCRQFKLGGRGVWLAGRIEHQTEGIVRLRALRFQFHRLSDRRQRVRDPALPQMRQTQQVPCVGLSRMLLEQRRQYLNEFVVPAGLEQ